MTLHVKNLSIHLNNKVLVEPISFSIEQGQCLSLVGESGAGKSLLSTSILNLLPPPIVRKCESILLDDEDISLYSNEEMQKIRGHKIGMVFQDPLTALNPLHTIEKQMTEMILIHQNITYSEAKTRTIELLDQVELPKINEKLKHYPHQLSGGQRQRIMIAMAIANSPQLLIADEPTTALDATVQQQILQLLKSLQKNLNIALLLISHDLHVVEKLSNYSVILKNGQCIEEGSTSIMLNNPNHQYTKELIKPFPHVENQSFNTETILKTQNLSMHYHTPNGWFSKKTNTILDNINLCVQSKATLGIVGESGSGKSTLAQAIIKLIPYQGNVIFNNQSLSNLNQKQMKPIRKELQIVFQDPYSSLNPRMRVFDIMHEGMRLSNQPLTYARILQTLQEVGLDESFMYRYPHECSGGQRQRIAIARTLILKPSCIVLDEPTSALDRTTSWKIIDLLKMLQEKEGISFIFISHDWQVIQALCHHVLVLKDGKVIEQGTCQDIIHNPTHSYTQTLIKASSLKHKELPIHA